MSEEKIVLVTGAGIGIGEATALAFAKNNYRVVVTDIVEEAGQATVSKIQDGGGRLNSIILMSVIPSR